MSHATADVLINTRDLIERLVTEDDEPVDNLFSAKQQRFLVTALYASWSPAPIAAGRKARRFLADVNIGLFFAFHQPPLLPDFFLSLDVAPHKDWYAKEHRSYFVWEFGKVPEVVVEIVSNRKGGELTSKLDDYAQMGINYYVVYDPETQLSDDTLRVYELGAVKRYQLRDDYALPEVGLRLKLWKGVFEGKRDRWLRWCDARGKLIPTGEERARTAEAELAKLRAQLDARKPRRKRAGKSGGNQK